MHERVVRDDEAVPGVVRQPGLDGRADLADVLLVGLDAVLELEGVQEDVGLVVVLENKWILF